VMANLVKSQQKKILPRGEWNYKPERSAAVVKCANLDTAEPKANEKIANLIESLGCGGRVIYRWRERPNRNIHHQTDGGLRILPDRPLFAQIDGLSQYCLLDFSSCSKDAQDGCPFDNYATHRSNNFDYRIVRCGDCEQSGHVNTLDSTR